MREEFCAVPPQCRQIVEKNIGDSKSAAINYLYGEVARYVIQILLIEF